MNIKVFKELSIKNNMEVETLKKIISELSLIRELYHLHNDDNNLFDCAVRIYNSENISINKNNFSKGNDGVKKEINKKASKKQINLLCELNADFDADTVTYKEADKLIKKGISKNHE